MRSTKSTRFRRVQMTIILSALAAAAPARAERPALVLPEGGYDEPLELVGNRPLLSVEVEGRGPYPFVLDVGSGSNVIDAGLATELGLEVVGEEEVGAPGLATVAAAVVRADALRFAGVEIGASRLVTVELAKMSGGAFVGVLSIHALRGALVELDYPAGRLRLSRGRLDPAAPGVVAFDLGDDGPIDVPMTIGPVTLPAHIDTGSPGRITIPRHLLAELTLSGEPVEAGSIGLVGGSGKLWRAQLQGTVAIGDLRLRDPEIAITDLPLPAANLGGGLLRETVLTLDMSHGLLTLEPAAAAAGGRPQPTRTVTAAPRAGRRTLGIRLVGTGPPGPAGLPLVDGGLAVGGVDPGSLAERAGIRAGDSIRSVNGRPVSELDARALGELFGGSETLRLAIRRGEETRDVVIGAP